MLFFTFSEETDAIGVHGRWTLARSGGTNTHWVHGHGRKHEKFETRN